ncbi:MAG: RloB family protein [Legionellaceae bacterium]|nr:RloB family protein [Legionellaceae bacterium]
MSQKRRVFQRTQGDRPYRKLYIIVVEGTKTEPQYFSMFNNQQSVIKIVCRAGKHSSPPYVMKKIRQHLKEENFKTTDEAWLVVDKDNWTEQQLTELYQWTKEANNYGLALSNPKFEYWLLLHFEEGNNITSSQECSKRLEQYIPDYNKGINVCKIKLLGNINDAIKRAKKRDTPPSIDWPRTIGNTTVYKLVESIQQATTN